MKSTKTTAQLLKELEEANVFMPALLFSAVIEKSRDIMNLTEEQYGKDKIITLELLQGCASEALRILGED